MQGETAAVERAFRAEYGRRIASLTRRFGDIDIAEEAAGEGSLASIASTTSCRQARPVPSLPDTASARVSLAGTAQAR